MPKKADLTGITVEMQTAGKERRCEPAMTPTLLDHYYMLSKLLQANPELCDCPVLVAAEKGAYFMPLFHAKVGVGAYNELYGLQPVDFVPANSFSGEDYLKGKHKNLLIRKTVCIWPLPRGTWFNDRIKKLLDDDKRRRLFGEDV